MSFNIKDLKFNVELASSMSHRSSFPRENCTGVALFRPDEKVRKYKLKVWLSKETCEKADIVATGFIMVRISDCSQAIQILYEEEQGKHFKGYSVRPLGGYMNKAQIQAHIKKKGSKYICPHITWR